MKSAVNIIPYIIIVILSCVCLNLMLPQSRISDKYISLQKCTSTVEDSVLDRSLKFINTLIKKEQKFFSQHEEDGILLALLEGIKPKYRYYVEFGTQDATEGNTRIFRDKINYTNQEILKNWTGLLLDGSNENAKINLHKEFLTHDNIVKLFQKYKVPKKFDVLSVDTDHKDFWMLESILAGGYRPRIIINEVNCGLGPYASLTIGKNRPEKYADFTNWFGFSVNALWLLARKFNYSMVYCEKTGVNCFTVIDGEEGFGPGFKLSNYYRSYHVFSAPGYWGYHKTDPKQRPYEVYKP